MNREEIRTSIRTALGEDKADIVVMNGSLVNVYTRKIQENCSVGIKGSRIVYVGEDPRYVVGANTKIIDASGMYITPGFIDPHTHLDSIFLCAEYARFAVPHGNTTAISESAMIANAAGKDGVMWFIEDTQSLPLRIFILTPSMIPPFPEFETSKGFSFEDFQKLLREDFVLGIGETYWPRVIDLDERALERYAAAQKLGKTREGHAAGARDERLLAYCAAGTSSCHEATTAEEALKRLQLGMGVMIREGSIRRELEAISTIKDLRLDLRRVMLCTDLADPEMLVHEGGMDELVRRAIACGFDPITAIQMVTINPADYFGLRELGGIAPGKVADLLLVADLRAMVVSKVLKDGVVVAEEGRLIVPLPPHRYPESAYHTFAVERVQEEDFCIPYSGVRARIRVIDAVNETITKEMQFELQAQHGNLTSYAEGDIIKISHIYKHSSQPQKGIGFIHGLGIRTGAVATSLVWDTNNILAIGATDREMAFAVNRLLENHGGLVVVNDEQVVAELPMPIFGLISDMPLEQIARKIAEVHEGCKQVGCTLIRPFLTLQTIAFTGLPYLRLTDRGLVDIRERKFVDLILS